MLSRRSPRRRTGVGAFDERPCFASQQRIVGDCDDTASGVSIGIAEGVQLFEIHISNAGFFVELASGRFIERLVLAHEPTRKSPAACEGRHSAPDQQHLQFPMSQRKDHEIDRDLNAGLRSHVSARWYDEHGALWSRSHSANGAGVELEVVGFDSAREDHAAGRHQRLEDHFLLGLDPSSDDRRRGMPADERFTNRKHQAWIRTKV
jgi:hypothetical protein